MLYNGSKNIDQKTAREKLEYFIDKGKVFELTEKRKKRTVSMNNLYWKWLTCLEEETGQPKEDYHDYFKDKYIGVSVKVVFGKKIIKEPTTTDKDTKDFSEYMKSVKHESFHDFNVILPEPDDLGFDKFIEKYYYV